MEYLDISTRVIAVIVAFVVALVTILQWRTNKMRLRLEVFEKRYEIYRSIKHVLEYIVVHDDLDEIGEDKIERFVYGVSETEFLFDGDVYGYVDDLKAKVMRWRIQNRMFSKIEDETRRREKVKEVSQLFDWILKQPPILRSKMALFLKIRV